MTKKIKRKIIKPFDITKVEEQCPYCLSSDIEHISMETWKNRYYSVKYNRLCLHCGEKWED